MIEGYKMWKVSYPREKRYPKDAGATENFYSSAEEIVHHIFKSQKQGGNVMYRNVYDEAHGFYRWERVGTTETFFEWLRTEPAILGKEKGYWSSFIGTIDKLAKEGRFRIYSTVRGRVTTGKVAEPKVITWPRKIVEPVGTPAYEAATFRISDIPDDWDLQLNKEFTDELDKFNRPWKHDPTVPRGRCMYWESGWLHKRTTSQMSPEQLRGYKERLAIYNRLWGNHRFDDPHYALDDPRRKVDTGGWILGSHLKTIRKHLDIDDADLGKYITGIRKGKASENTRHEIKGLMPIRPDENWARLFGLYFSGGSILARQRYITDHFRKTAGSFTHGGTYDAIMFRLRMQEDVVAWCLESLSAIHSDAAYRNPMKSAVYLRRLGMKRRTKSRRSKTLPVINLSWPELLIMKKMGLPELEKKPNRRGSRTVKPRIPEWIKENDSFMKAFVEGYLNGPSSSIHFGLSRTNILPHINLYHRIRCYGSPLEDVEAFIKDIAAWLTGKGLTCRIRKVEIYTVHSPGYHEFDISISKIRDIRWMSDNLEIVKADTRAGTLLRLESQSDQFLYEALRDTTTNQAYVLGSLLEEKQTPDELAYSLPLSRESVMDALKRLQLRGIVTRSGDDYIYNPRAFRERVIEERSDALESIRKRRARYSTKLLHQCKGCQRIYLAERSKCSLCGSEVEPVFRDKTLRSLRHSEAYLEKVIATLRMAN